MHLSQVLGMLGVSRPLRKCNFSMPELLDVPVVAITKNSYFFEKFFLSDDLGLFKKKPFKTFFYIKI
jgi:hypothetical protein